MRTAGNWRQRRRRRAAAGRSHMRVQIRTTPSNLQPRHPAARTREREAREQAESADQAKDEFLATVSHELRTPLTPILSWAGMLRRRTIDAPTTTPALEAIERTARVQRLLVEDLLDISRIITGRMRLDVRPVELAPVIEAAIEAVSPA